MNKMKVLGLTLVCGLFLAACSTDETPKEQSNESADSTVVESSVEESSESVPAEEPKKETTGDFVDSAADAYFDGEMLKGNTYSIRITEYKIIPVGEKGNEYGETPVIAFWYDTLVNPDYDNQNPINPTSAWISNFEAVQDNDPNMVNELQIASLPDDAFLDSQTAKIKPGGTLQNAVAYELTDLETPVQLTAKSIMGDEFGSKEFNIK